MTKTIWYVSKYFAPETDDSAGGRGWLLMKEFAKQGYKPIVISSNSNNLVSLPKLQSSMSLEEKQGVSLIWLRTLKYSVAKSVLRILSWVHFEWKLFWLKKSAMTKPDVIIVSSLSLLSILNGLILKKKYSCRLVFEIRDIWPLTIVEEGGFSPRNPLVLCLGLIERLGYKYSDLIVGTMPNLGDHVKQILGYERNVKCIPMGVDVSKPHDDVVVPADYINKYLDSSKFNVVHAGTVGITNALDTFFKAADLMKDFEGIRFVIVGDGALKSYYFDKYGHLPNVVFAPKVSKNMVQSVLIHSDLLYFSVYKSKVWEYGQSLNKVIDYMMAGKPIVASYSGYPSMINEAGCGSYVPAEDPASLVNEIKRYFNMTAEQRNSIGLKGRAWLLENRSYKKLASEYISILFDKETEC
jgi:glycosyltransferase involved in cell wall biosynthesis